VPKPVFGRAVRAGNLVFLSGVTGKGPDTGTQIKSIFESIKTTLEEVGSSLENVINATVYLTDLEEREKYLNPIWSELFPRNPPTRTTVQVVLAPPDAVEITVVALVPEVRLYTP